MNPREITFRVSLGQPLPPGDSLYLSILDEVTGLTFNTNKFSMRAESPQVYTVSLTLDHGAVIKYRYFREGENTTYESDSLGRSIRYRLLHVDGGTTREDIISGWLGGELNGFFGRISGRVLDSTINSAVPGILVTAGGIQAFSNADGSFLLDGLPPGLHNLVFYSIDGSYEIFQQDAIVAANSTTPASVYLTPSKWVTVIFAVNIPKDTPTTSPIRFAGNLYQLGSTFSDLPGGVSTLASKMPVLGRLSDGRYMLTLSLPVGSYIEYKYTLGDGLTSSELTENGSFQLRKLLIPDVDISVVDTIATWKKKSTNPIHIEVQVPESTPGSESISIQFNPGFGWMEPIPMNRMTNSMNETVWNFDLTGPFSETQSMRYRYCRQEQCGVADDAATMGDAAQGHTLNRGSNSVIQDEVLQWAWGDASEPSVDFPLPPVSIKGLDFTAGIALQPTFRPSWSSKLEQSILEVNGLKVNSLIFTPTWTYTNKEIPNLEILPSHDMLWFDLSNSIRIAERQGLHVGIYPQPNFQGDAAQWWVNSKRDYSWWVVFFESYSRFILHHASVAETTDASILVLGGDWLNPALPGGRLISGEPSNVPQDAEERWRELLRQVRERYNGKIAWSVVYPIGINNPPPFLDAVDEIFILWSAPLASHQDATLEEMQSQANTILQAEILPFTQQVSKPIIIAIAYPSVNLGAMGCIQILGGGCLDYTLLNLPNPDISALELNLQQQAFAYQAILSAINTSGYISGFVSMGYQPIVPLADKSLSIHGKPASVIVEYWSQNFLGK